MVSGLGTCKHSSDLFCSYSDVMTQKSVYQTGTSLWCYVQELDVAVSLSLFVSRMAELDAQISTVIASLPSTLSSAAQSTRAFAAVFHPAATATAAASAAHRLAEDLKVRLPSSMPVVTEHSICIMVALRFGGQTILSDTITV